MSDTIPEPTLCEPWPPGQCRTLVAPYRCMENVGHGGECRSYGLGADGNEVDVPMGVWPEHREFMARAES